VPHLANTKYNKYVLAVTILGMVPALPSFSVNERESSKHALGMLLKDILELEMTNSLALTLSEREIVESAQQFFLETSEPSFSINLDSPPAVAHASGLGEEHHSLSPSSKPFDNIFTEDEVRQLRAVSISIGKNAGLQGFVDFALVGGSTAAVGLGVVSERGDQVPLGTLVKSLGTNGTTVSVRGLGGNRIPDAPEMFDDVKAAIVFMQPYLYFMSARTSTFLK
jgi:hypothetical protein